MIIAANFKANLSASVVAEYIKYVESKLDSSLKNELIIFPNFISLQTAKDFAKKINIGTQNAYPALNGAFTGEITLEALQTLDIKTILIGHSERRILLNETQQMCNEKFRFYKNQDFKIIYCIGENLDIKEKGESSILKFLENQLKNIDLDYKNLIIAYEPIWAIGSGKSATLNDISFVSEFIKTKTKAPILYGGSVNENNAKEILALQNIDGLLIGSAALNANTFLNIIKG